MDAFEKWRTAHGLEVVPSHADAFRAGMRAAAEIVANQLMTIAWHMKPYEPIDAINAELLLEDCADACDEIAKAILAEADKP